MYSFKEHRGMQYCEYLPLDFDKNKKYPVIFFLHGAGERGQDKEKLLVMGPMQAIARGENIPFIVISPKCVDNIWYDHFETLDSLFCEYLANPFVDTSRVYMSGASMGGYGTWGFAMSHADRLAAIVPICGGGVVWNVGTLRDLPVWAFHSNRDPVVDVGESQRMIDALRKVSNTEVRFTVYDSTSHNAWTPAYEEPEIYEWLLSKHR